MALEIGQKHKSETIVTLDQTVVAPGAYDFRVFSTPAMIMLMELSCFDSLQPTLEDGLTSVGIHVDVYHTSAALMDEKVWAESELTEIDGRRFAWKVTAYSENGELGHGIHERKIIKISP
jgi:predicted thioesterase